MRQEMKTELNLAVNVQAVHTTRAIRFFCILRQKEIYIPKFSDIVVDLDRNIALFEDIHFYILPEQYTGSDC